VNHGRLGITAVAEVRRGEGGEARGDRHHHHRPGTQLPDSPIVRRGGPTIRSGALRHGSSTARQALFGVESEIRSVFDLVALATIAEVVPLVEGTARSRSQASRLASTQKPGLQAPMERGRRDPAIVESGAWASARPGINAAGRSVSVGVKLCYDGPEAEGSAPRGRASGSSALCSCVVSQLMCDAGR